MEKGKYLIVNSVWKPAGKSRRMAREIAEKEGYIDLENSIAYTINSYGDCSVTDIATGMLVYSCCGKSIEYIIDKYGESILDAVNKARNSNYYEGCVRVFEYLKTCTEPVTEQQLRKILT